MSVLSLQVATSAPIWPKKVRLLNVEQRGNNLQWTETAVWVSYIKYNSWLVNFKYHYTTFKYTCYNVIKAGFVFFISSCIIVATLPPPFFFFQNIYQRSINTDVFNRMPLMGLTVTSYTHPSTLTSWRYDLNLTPRLLTQSPICVRCQFSCKYRVSTTGVIHHYQLWKQTALISPIIRH